MTNWELYRAAQIKKAKKEAETKETTLVELINRTITEIHDESVTIIGKSAFRICTDLALVDLPNAIQMFDYAFGNDISLTNVYFPKMRNIGYAAFSACTNLHTAEFPVLESIGGSAFGSTALSTLIIRNEGAVVRLADSTCLSNSPIARGTGYIYVPDALVDSYKTANNWSTYAAQIKPLSELPTEGE